ncbi:MAG: phage holin family protein [Pseudomonadales bacterium]|jgi:putative membrane protein|tara:strand:+ start:6021 stop:6353 length:333 start_codon:yes stop_codon:yes gene_type:complete
MDLILHVLLLGAVIFFIAEALPGITIDGFGTALVVAVVYGLINVFLGTVLKIISFPFIFITLGVFLLFINTFLLWLTDQLVDDFEIDNLGTTFVAAVIITLSDSVLGWVF